MASLIGKVIAGWNLQEVLKCTPYLSIYNVCSTKNAKDKYCMTILYKDGKNPDCSSSSVVISKNDVNVNVRPEFGYYDSHCFPIIPTENNCGKYNGHDFFVYERISKPLNYVLRKGFYTSHDDFINIAIQIMKILQFLFNKKKILKNLDIEDFCLRRTTNGYRVFLINQDFYTGEAFDIEDPTYTSVSVMKGNEEPTMGDNVVSFAYIMLSIYNSSLPWSGDSNKESILTKKMDDELIESLCDGGLDLFLRLIKKYNLPTNQKPSLEQEIAKLRQEVEVHSITFGNVLSKYSHKRSVPPLTSLDYYANPVIQNEEETVEEEKEKMEEKEEEEEKMEEKEEEKMEEKEEEEEKMEEKEEMEEKKMEEEKMEEKMEKEKEEEKKEEKPQTPLDQGDIPSDALPKRKSEKRETSSNNNNNDNNDKKRRRILGSSKKSLKQKSVHFFSSATFSNIMVVSGVVVASMIGM